MSAKGETATRNRKRASAPSRTPKNIEEGKLNGHSAELHSLLHALQAVKTGDFSVRMSGHETGFAGKIADTFNEIVANNQRMAHQLEHVGQLVGREGQTRHRVKLGSCRRLLGRDGRLHQQAYRRSALAHDGSDARDRSRGAGRPAADGARSMSRGDRSRASSCGRPPSSTR